MPDTRETAESVAARLREDICTGKLPKGAKVPTAAQLQAEYQIGRGAAQRVLATLRAEGLITIQRGAPGVVKGAFGRLDRVMPDRITTTLRGNAKSIQHHDAGPREVGTSVDVDEVPAPDYVAEAFGIEVGDLVVQRSRVHLVDKRRVQLSSSYFPVEVARGTAIVYRNPGPRGVYGCLADQGLSVTSVEECIVARPPLPAEMATLDLPRSRGLVFEITRYAKSGDRCVEVNRMVLDAEVYRLVNKFPLCT